MSGGDGAVPGFGKALSRAMRAMVPRGLLGRSILIILLPIVVLEVVALLLFYGGHLDVVSRRLSGGVAGDVAMVAELVRREPPENRAWIFREASWRLDLNLAFEEGARIQAVERPASLPLLPLEEDLNRALAERVRAPFDTDWQTDPRSVVIRVQLPEGVLHVEAPRKRLFTATLYLFVIWLVGSALLLSAVAVLFMKNQVRAVRPARRRRGSLRARPRHRRHQARGRDRGAAGGGRLQPDARAHPSLRRRSGRRCWPASATTSAPPSPACAWRSPCCRGGRRSRRTWRR